MIRDCFGFLNQLFSTFFLVLRSLPIEYLCSGEDSAAFAALQYVRMLVKLFVLPLQINVVNRLMCSFRLPEKFHKTLRHWNYQHYHDGLRLVVGYMESIT